MTKVFLTDEEIEMERRHQQRLKLQLPIPPDIDGNSDQMRVIICYNRNIVGAGCTTMNGVQAPNDSCRRYCPYVIRKFGPYRG